MKLTLVVLLVVLAALVHGDMHGGKKHMGKKGGFMKEKGFGKRGHDFKPPKGAEENGKEMSFGVVRLKIIEKAGKFFFWRELPESECQKPERPERPEDKPEGGSDKPAGDMSDEESEPEEGEEGEEEVKGCPSQPTIFNINAIYETDADGKPVEDKNRVVRNMKDVTFDCPDPAETAVAVPGSTDGLMAYMMMCTLTLANEATVTLDMYLASNNGSVTMGEESTDVMEGQLKFSTKISNWPMGAAMVQLEYMIGSGSKKPRRGKGKGKGMKKTEKLTFDNDGEVEISNMVEIDGRPEEIPGGAKVEEDGPNIKVTIMFNSTCSTGACLYDPVSSAPTVDDLDLGSPSGSGAIYVSVSSLLLILMTAIFGQY